MAPLGRALTPLFRLFAASFFIALVWACMGMQLYQQPMHNNCAPPGAAAAPPESAGVGCSTSSLPWHGPT